MTDQIENIVLRELDINKLREYVDESLREDNIAESCYTNFKDAIVETISKTIKEILGKDGWKVKAFEKCKKEKIFKAFMENGEIKVLLGKKIDKRKYKFKKVIVKFDFPETEKKKIADEYINNILESYYYLDICLFIELEEDIDIDTVSKILSGEVYGLLSPEEIKAEFKD
jgi:hypothetical protein